MIHYDILVNAIILILILHLIVSNLENSKEHFESPEKKEEKEALEDIVDEDLTFKNMNQNKNVPKSSTKKNKMKPYKQNTIPPANTYDVMDSHNVPNFESNVLDFNKFYKINNNTDEPVRKNYIQSPSTPRSSVSVSPTPLPNADNGKTFSRNATNLPSTWEYANELPMNGGMFGSIVGLDSGESLYSSYGNGVSIKKCGNEVVKRVAHNDLRKPIVYN